MAFTAPSYDVNNIQGLATVTKGQATAVKVLHDKTGADTKTYLLDTMIPELNALDAANVKKTGDQTIAGVKTFSSSPIVPTPTTDMQASTKKYVDDHKASTDHLAIKIPYDSTGNTKITGTTVQAALTNAENELKAIIGVNANVEVASALVSTVKSKTFVDLDGRLEESEQDLVSYQAETASEISELQTIKVDKNGSSQVTMEMLTPDVRTSMTGGSVAVVGINSVDLRTTTLDMAKILGYYASAVMTHDADNYCDINTAPYYPTASVSKRTAYIACVAGDKFKFSNRVTQFFSGYVFLNVGGTIVSSRALSSGTVDINEEISAPIGAVMLYVNSTVDVIPTLSKIIPYDTQAKILAVMGKVSKYAEIKDTIINLFTAFAAWGSATVLGLVATVSGQNGGMLSNTITSTGNNVSVKLEGSFTIPTLAVQLKITKNDASVEYVYLGTIAYTDGVIDIEFSFDPTYYAVYHDGASYNILINSVGSATPGTITLTSIVIDDEITMKQSDYYNIDFTTMMSNVFSGIDTAKTLPVHSTTDVFMKNGDSNNFKIQVGIDGTLQSIPCAPSSALIMGNSLLLGMGDGEFGMCASSADNDFYYYVTEAILAKNAGCTFAKLHDGDFEQAESTGVYDAYYTTNIASFGANLDLIIMQIGDNVNTVNRIATFITNFPLLLKKIRNQCTKARIIIVGIWFNGNGIYDDIDTACAAYGCELVDIRDLNITANQGYSGQTYTLADSIVRTVDDAWITHPGDVGHQLISDRIITQLNM